ncbi:hypothetical protein NEMIN01_1325 [Nematocida minor]|uniref:uncharacterized protein n=1 Tax=Nematocida minor TaxID=1912983 RepID=UPI0022203E82|nr:uncharacterized protein NEMIN01_1325 [Nematocida minor]KAI5190992.1 hypothetical protein NEMIN01_1325 [Nematocida minor]
MGVQEHALISEKMYDLFDQINDEVDNCLRYSTRKEQNQEFAKIDFIPDLNPIRLSEMTAVFELTGNIRQYLRIKETESDPQEKKGRVADKIIIKRVILKMENNPEEEAISTMVDHPHVVKTHLTYRCNYINSKGVDQALLWLFIEALNVKVSLKENAKKENEIRDIMKDTLKGLEYLHGSHIAHLDLKLANVMGYKDENSNIIYKIIDFGFSRKLPESQQEETYPKRCYGTFPYKPPEVWISSIHGFASDIWCVGAMSLFLANRKSAYFQKKTPNANAGGNTKDYAEFRQFLEETVRIKIDSETSPELVSFIKDCMQRNRKNRPTATELLKHSFILGEKLSSQAAKKLEYYV